MNETNDEISLRDDVDSIGELDNEEDKNLDNDIETNNNVTNNEGNDDNAQPKDALVAGEEDFQSRAVSAPRVIPTEEKRYHFFESICDNKMWTFGPNDEDDGRSVSSEVTTEGQNSIFSLIASKPNRPVVEAKKDFLAVKPSKIAKNTQPGHDRAVLLLPMMNDISKVIVLDKIDAEVAPGNFLENADHELEGFVEASHSNFNLSESQVVAGVMEDDVSITTGPNIHSNHKSPPSVKLVAQTPTNMKAEMFFGDNDHSASFYPLKHSDSSPSIHVPSKSPTHNSSAASIAAANRLEREAATHNSVQIDLEVMTKSLNDLHSHATNIKNNNQANHKLIEIDDNSTLNVKVEGSEKSVSSTQNSTFNATNNENTTISTANTSKMKGSHLKTSRSMNSLTGTDRLSNMLKLDDSSENPLYRKGQNLYFNVNGNNRKINSQNVMKAFSGKKISRSVGYAMYGNILATSNSSQSIGPTSMHSMYSGKMSLQLPKIDVDPISPSTMDPTNTAIVQSQESVQELQENRIDVPSLNSEEKIENEDAFDDNVYDVQALDNNREAVANDMEAATVADNNSISSQTFLLVSEGRYIAMMEDSLANSPIGGNAGLPNANDDNQQASRALQGNTVDGRPAVITDDLSASRPVEGDMMSVGSSISSLHEDSDLEEDINGEKITSKKSKAQTKDSAINSFKSSPYRLEDTDISQQQQQLMMDSEYNKITNIMSLHKRQASKDPDYIRNLTIKGQQTKIIEKHIINVSNSERSIEKIHERQQKQSMMSSFAKELASLNEQKRTNFRTDDNADIVPFQIHRRILGWKLTSVNRRKDLVSLLDLLHEKRVSRNDKNSLKMSSTLDTANTHDGNVNHSHHSQHDDGASKHSSTYYQDGSLKSSSVSLNDSVLTGATSQPPPPQMPKQMSSTSLNLRAQYPEMRLLSHELLKEGIIPPEIFDREVLPYYLPGGIAMLQEGSQQQGNKPQGSEEDESRSNMLREVITDEHRRELCDILSKNAVAPDQVKRQLAAWEDNVCRLIRAREKTIADKARSLNELRKSKELKASSHKAGFPSDKKDGSQTLHSKSKSNLMGYFEDESCWTDKLHNFDRNDIITSAKSLSRAQAQIMHLNSMQQKQMQQQQGINNLNSSKSLLSWQNEGQFTLSAEEEELRKRRLKWFGSEVLDDNFKFNPRIGSSVGIGDMKPDGDESQHLSGSYGGPDDVQAFLQHRKTVSRESASYLASSSDIENYRLDLSARSNTSVNSTQRYFREINSTVKQMINADDHTLPPIS